mgnify:CR=1 FL=1
MTTPAPHPAMSLALSEVAIETSKTHRAQLAHRIGTYQAMLDEMLIDVALMKERGQPTVDAEAKAQELAARIQLLRQRLMQLLVEFHGGASAEPAPPAVKKPWERERFKKEVAELSIWADWLVERAAGFSFSDLVAALARNLQTISSDPAAIPDRLQRIADYLRHYQSLPWYLFCPASALYDQIEKAQRLEALCTAAGFGLPAVEKVAAMELLRQLAADATAHAYTESQASGDTMKAQTGAAIAHYGSSDPASRLRAIQIISGLSLPDHLRFTQNLTVRLMTDAQE